MIIDDFLPDLPLVKRFIKDTHYGTHDLLGKTYTGFGRVSLPVKALIEEVMGPVSIRVCYLRKGGRDTPLTYGIHADRAVASHAFVLCLSEPDCASGTMFWKHKETGLEELPVPTDPELFDLLNRDIDDETKWEQVSFIETKENRAVIFNAAKFHSRWPKVIESDTPRIVCTAFFDVNEEITSPIPDMPAILKNHLTIPRVERTGKGILPWDQCKDLQDVLECNAVNLDSCSMYFDHDHNIASITPAPSKKRLEACKLALSMGYTPLEVSYG